MTLVSTLYGDNYLVLTFEILIERGGEERERERGGGREGGMGEWRFVCRPLSTLNPTTSSLVNPP